MGKTRLCLIGAGPSGMSFLYNLEVARKEGKDVPDVICFDRQSNWGGLWNYTWRTGESTFFFTHVQEMAKVTTVVEGARFECVV